MYADVLVQRLGLSATWLGVILLATVTSLPELVTGAAAVTVAGAPDIALGDALGSCIFNLGLLVLLDFMHPSESLYRRASQGHILSAAFGIVLLGVTGLSIVAHAAPWPAAGHMGPYAPVLLVLYLIAMRVLFFYERREIVEHTEEVADRHPGITAGVAGRRYAAWSLVVGCAGILLPPVGMQIAVQMEWTQTFVGSLFVAGATSLPELAVTVGALRLGALDLAIGNLLGSNLFNMLIVAVDDLLYVPGPILSAVSPVHAASALTASIMSGIVIIGLLYRSNVRLFGTIGWVSLALFVLYLLNSYVLFLHGG
jgi:cation:H+ antiporter